MQNIKPPSEKQQKKTLGEKEGKCFDFGLTGVLDRQDGALTLASAGVINFEFCIRSAYLQRTKASCGGLLRPVPPPPQNTLTTLIDVHFLVT